MLGAFYVLNVMFGVILHSYKVTEHLHAMLQGKFIYGEDRYI